jgi:type I restriction enzyme S subunit
MNTELPKDWKWVKLEEICEKLSLNKIKIQQKDYLREGKYPVVDQGQELIGGYYNNEKLIVPDEPPFIIFGDHTKVKKYITFKFIAGADGIKVLKAKKEINPKFFYYSLFRIKIEDKGYARHFQFLEKAEFPLPPLLEQHRIVAKLEELLSELEKGKEQLHAALDQLKVYRQAVLKYAFEGKLTNKNVKEGELPKGWKWVKLKEISKIIGGVTKGKDYKGKKTIRMPYLRVANVQDGYLDLRLIKEIDILPEEISKYELKYGDVLYTEGGDKDKLGRGTIWKDEIPHCIHQNHIFRARPDDEIIQSKYLAYYSQSETAKKYFYKHGKQTTNLASINSTILSNLPVPVCTIREQEQIMQEIESRLSVADKLEETITASLQQSETLRQSILKKAFEGKLV